MAKAVVDPAELRRFAQDLKKFALELQQQQAGQAHHRHGGQGRDLPS